MKNKLICFVDMDGVLANFDGGVGRPNFDPDPPEMFVKGFFRNLKVMPGARAAISAILEMSHIDLYIGSKPTTSNPHCASEKVEWIGEHFPELLKKMLLICDKTLLRGDLLIDDDQKWKGFNGLFIHFNPEDSEKCWETIVRFLRTIRV